MHLILLGGNSPKNEPWIEEVAQALSEEFDGTHIQYFDHWEKGGSIDTNKEREKLKSIAEEIDGEYAVFAKSAGVILTLDAIVDRDIVPQQCFFVGSPLGASAPERLHNYTTPTLFIQQTDDPIRPFQKLSNVLENSDASNYELIEIPGDDHIYGDITTLKNEIVSFVHAQEGGT